MLVRTSIGFLKKLADAQFSIVVKGVLDDMTDNAYFQTPPPTPPLPIIQAALDTFNTKLAVSKNGGVLATQEKNDARAVVADLMLQLSRYLDNVCAGNMTALISSGFPAQKAQRNPIGLLPAPAGLTAALGVQSGTLNVAVAPLKGAGSYTWRVTTVAAPNVVVQTAQSLAASTILTGLTPGVLYNIQANAVGAAGVSDWCAPVQLMVV